MPQLAAIVANAFAGLIQLVGVTIMLTTRFTGDLGAVSTTGLVLTSVGFALGAITTGPAIRAVYIWSRDRGYRLYHEHQAQDAALAAAAPPAVVPINRANPL